MPVCTSCHQTKQDGAFFHKNKKWKTCQHCIEQRALKKQNLKRKREEEGAANVRAPLKALGFMELSAHVAAEIKTFLANSTSDPGGNPPCAALNLRIALNISNEITGNEKPKDIARLIVEEVERADEYNWTYNCMNTSMRHKDVAKFYYVCSQSIVSMKEHKEGSNRKRMERFPCQGKMQMKIDLPAGEAMLEISHALLHGKPAINSEIGEECRKEIEENVLLDPIQLRQLLRVKGLMKNYTSRQIHTYWEGVASLKVPSLVTRYSVVSPEQFNPQGFSQSLTTTDNTNIIDATATGTNNTINSNLTVPIIHNNYIVPSIPTYQPFAQLSLVNNPTLPSETLDSKEKTDQGLNREQHAEYVNKLEKFTKRVRNQLDQGNYVWLDTVRIMTAGIIQMENDIEELVRQRDDNDRVRKPWTLHYK
nr:9962_t:CDS:2 [Entrophospora candida]